MAINIELLERLPKVELHCHLDGCLRVETVLDLAQKGNIKLPSFDYDILRKALTIGDNRVTLILIFASIPYWNSSSDTLLLIYKIRFL